MVATTQFLSLTDAEVTQMTSVAEVRHYQPGQVVFAEGDVGDAMYVVVSGQVAIHIDKSGKVLQIAALGPGQFFGEMSLFTQDSRNATAIAVGEVELLRIGQEGFADLIRTHHELAEKLRRVFQQRNDELLLKEQLVATTGINQDNLHVSIKGDPSMRETAFTRERYESIADGVLPKLIPCLHRLLFETTVYRIFVGLNNGEVRINSVINPFVEELHSVKKIVSRAYIDRHFPPMDYSTKVKMMHGVTEYIEGTREFAALPQSWNHILDKIQDDWRPVLRAELELVLDRLVELRKIPNFYLRNLSLSVAQDAIRMQFNCDGTHIVSARQYPRFLEENIVI